MRVTFGSRNPSKLARMRELFGVLGIDLTGLGRLDVAEPPESGCVEGNAILKARTYAAAVGRPCIANDYGLRLEGLSGDEQPGAYVRRRPGDGSAASDEEMMAFYVRRIEQLGGSALGTWTAALAIAFDPDDVVSTVASHTRTFLSRPSAVVLPGEPLASLQIDPQTGRYLSEVTFGQRATQRSPIDSAYVRFVEAHLPRLRALCDASR